MEQRQQTHVLRVMVKTSCNCTGCEMKIRKILKNNSGVKAYEIDMVLGKVTVTGNVDLDSLIKNLEKSGKRLVEIWPSQKVSSVYGNINTGQSDDVSSQSSTNAKFKGEKDPRKDGGAGSSKQKQIAKKQLRSSRNSKQQVIDDDDDDSDDSEEEVTRRLVKTGASSSGSSSKGMVSNKGKAIAGTSEGNRGILGKNGKAKLPAAQGSAATPTGRLNGGNGSSRGGPMGPTTGPYQQSMYWRPPQSGYVPSLYYDDPITNIFNDENTESCRVM
ncbi:hypothetical protein V2J09_019631 [Rumex salicifolius]